MKELLTNPHGDSGNRIYVRRICRWMTLQKRTNSNALLEPCWYTKTWFYYHRTREQRKVFESSCKRHNKKASVLARLQKKKQRPGFSYQIHAFEEDWTLTSQKRLKTIPFNERYGSDKTNKVSKSVGVLANCLVRWARMSIQKHKQRFLSTRLQKMKDVELFDLRACRLTGKFPNKPYDLQRTRYYSFRIRTSTLKQQDGVFRYSKTHSFYDLEYRQSAQTQMDNLAASGYGDKQV
jgi:hypothetical protein